MKANAPLIAALFLGATVVSAEAKGVVGADGDQNCDGCKIHQQDVDTTKPMVLASPRCPSGKRVMGRCLQ